MAATGKKEYTIVINGISQGIKEVTTLEEALSFLGVAVDKTNKANGETAKSSKEKKVALTDEQKALAKLLDTQQKTKDILSGVNDAQIEATHKLKEATREQTLKIKENIAEKNSVEELRIQVSRLTDVWKKTDMGSDDFKRLTTDLNDARDRLKEVEGAAGDFRRNVGNYEGALKNMSAGFEGVTKSSMGLAQSLVGTLGMLSLFGLESEDTAKTQQQLMKIIGLLSIAQKVNTNIVKEGIVQNKLAIVTDNVRLIQLKAKTAAEALSTKGTIAATVAQKAFNLVASANLYVILALSLVAVGAALYAFARGAGTAEERQKKLNEQEKIYLEYLGKRIEFTKQASDEQVADIERQIKVLEAMGGKENEIAKLRQKQFQIRKQSAKEIEGKAADEIKSLEENRKEIELLTDKIGKLKEQAKGKNKINFDFGGKTEIIKNVDKYMTSLQSELDKRQASVDIAVSAVNNSKDLETEEKAEAERLKKEAIERAKERAKVELDAVRAAGDARLKLIENMDEQAQKILSTSFDRQIEDLKTRLKEEKNLTTTARKAINDTIKSLELQKGIELEKLQKEQAEKSIALTREVEDSRLNLIVGEYDKQYVSINLQYDRQIEAYKKRLEEEKSLTVEQQNEITEIIENTQKERGAALAKLQADELKEQSETELSGIESSLTIARNRIGEILERDKGGLKLIDVDATKNNLSETNSALDEYISGIKGYLTDLKTSHEVMLDGLKEGTPEYEEEMQRYAIAVSETGAKIEEAQDEIVENTKKSGELIQAYYAELFSNISMYADAFAQSISMGVEAASMVLQAQLDELSETLDALDEKYEKAKEDREKAAEHVEKIEQQMQDATGGTVDALRTQLQDAMHARAQAEREEEKLAREKEKLEKEMAKKEKQMKKADLVDRIVMAGANIAAGIAQALGSMPPPLSWIMAGVTGAMGAVQIGIMTAQLAKLEKGGEIIGASHANGGVPIPGTNYEAEGGEFVINKVSYSANEGLVKMINSTPGTVTAADLLGFVSGSISVSNQPQENNIAQAIQGIAINPVVAVTDIENASDTIVSIRDISGVNQES